MRVTMKIDGLDDIIKNLGRLDVKSEFIDSANQAVAEVKKRALVEVPVDTSMLQKSHILSPATMFRPTAEVYTDKEYAVPVHEGHKAGPTRVKSNPWMQRAVDKSSGKVNKIFEKTGDKVAKLIVK